MKKLFTLAVLALSLAQFSFAQDEAGFTPPEGSTYNEDSTVVTLPDAQIGDTYNEVISFFSPEIIEIEGVDYELTFVSATITSIAAPDGLVYSCNEEGCVFLPNNEGEVSLTGIPTTAGTYELAVNADVSISAIVFGFPASIDFSLPYDGGNAILDLALAEDYSVINSLLPSFILNVNEEIGIEELSPFAGLVVYPNPATTEVSFEYSSESEATQVQLFDLLGNLVFNNTFSKESSTVNTSSLNNGVYIYKLATANHSSVGRLIVNK